MQKRIWLLTLLVTGAVATGVSLYSQGRAAKPARTPGAMAFRILLGVGDKQDAPWDGSAKVSSGQILGIQGWRFVDGDSTDSKSSWKASSRKSNSQSTRPTGPLAVFVMFETGVIVEISDANPAAELQITTKQGNFSFQARDVAWGEPKRFLDGRAVVERVPLTQQLTRSNQDQDFPAIAQMGDAVYASYVEFTHGDPQLEAHRPMTEAPKNFDYLSRPAGGDQVFLLTYSKSKRTWSEPVAVSAPKQDIMRTAVAVDGSGRVWVFWSAKKDGNFDIYAKSYSDGRWSAEMRLTTDPGTDVNPVATTDAQGRVWVAWQGFRNHNLEILAAAQVEQRPTQLHQGDHRFLLAGQRLGPGYRRGAQWRSGGFLGHLRQGRLRRLLPPAQVGRRDSHGRARSRRREPEFRSPQFHRLRCRRAACG